MYVWLSIVGLFNRQTASKVFVVSINVVYIFIVTDIFYASFFCFSFRDLRCKFPLSFQQSQTAFSLDLVLPMLIRCTMPGRLTRRGIAHSSCRAVLFFSYISKFTISVSVSVSVFTLLGEPTSATCPLEHPPRAHTWPRLPLVATLVPPHQAEPWVCLPTLWACLTLSVPTK